MGSIGEIKLELALKFGYCREWLDHADDKLVRLEIEELRRAESEGRRPMRHRANVTEYVSVSHDGRLGYAYEYALLDFGFSLAEIKEMGDTRAFDKFCALTKTPRPDWHLERMARLEARERRAADKKAEEAGNPKIVRFKTKPFGQ